MPSSFHRPSRVHLWARRYAFYLRRLPCVWVLAAVCGCLLLIVTVPNPFAARYSRTSLRQDVQWESIQEILQVKDQVKSITFVSETY